MRVTVPETVYFPVSFAQRSLTLRSPSVQRAFIIRSWFVHRSQFCVHRSACARVPVHKAFIVRSPCVQLLFTKHSSIAHPSQRVKPISFGTPTCGRVENFLCISEISLIIKKRQDYQRSGSFIQKKMKYLFYSFTL